MVDCGRMLLISSVVCLLSTAAAVPDLYAYTDPEYDPVIYDGVFFTVLEQAGSFELYEYDEEESIKLLLEEARYVFSAMIYGMDFNYVPSDKARSVEEEFSVEPVYQFPWGDKGLEVRDGRLEDGKYIADIRYRVSEEQLPWVFSWETNIYPDVISLGKGSLYDGYEGKIEAVEDAVRQALRDYLRPRMYNKPGRISGTARLAGIPVFSMDSGRYLCRAKITLRIDEVREYGLF